MDIGEQERRIKPMRVPAPEREREPAPKREREKEPVKEPVKEPEPV